MSPNAIRARRTTSWTEIYKILCTACWRTTPPLLRENPLVSWLSFGSATFGRFFDNSLFLIVLRVDKKTVNVISTGIFNDDLKVMNMTLNFFLSKDGRDADEEKEKEDGVRFFSLCIFSFLRRKWRNMMLCANTLLRTPRRQERRPDSSRQSWRKSKRFVSGSLLFVGYIFSHIVTFCITVL